MLKNLRLNWHSAVQQFCGKKIVYYNMNVLLLTTSPVSCDLLIRVVLTLTPADSANTSLTLAQLTLVCSCEKK